MLCFVQTSVAVLEATDIHELYSKAVDKIMESMALFQMQGSNWGFKAMQRLEINTVVYMPLKGKLYIPLPPVLVNKEAIINLKNKGNKCFKACDASVESDKSYSTE